MTVSVIIPTFNRTRLLMERSLPSVLSQTYRDLEVLVVGDGTEQATVRAMAKVNDSRVSFVNLKHFDYPSPNEPDWEHRRWALLGMAARNYGLDHAHGEFVAMLDDDDALRPDAIETLVRTQEWNGADFVYGVSRVFKGDKSNGLTYGRVPPGPGAFCVGSFIYRASLGYRFGTTCPSRFHHALDADMWVRMLAAGVDFYFVDKYVHDYYKADS